MTFRRIEFGSDDFRKECDLRHRILRLPIGLNISDEDLSVEKYQCHFGLFDDGGGLFACIIAVPLSCTRAKLRQMAVSEAFQNQGCGSQLIRKVETRLEEFGFVHISMNARSSAVGFYEKLGYSKTDDEFLEVGIPHFRMEKDLISKSCFAL